MPGEPENLFTRARLRTNCPAKSKLLSVQQPNFHCDVRTSFAAAFGTWRRKHNVPLKKIAGDLGVSISTVSCWELGKRFPTGHNFELLVNYTSVPPCRLFCVMASKCVPRECLLAMGRSS